MYNIHPTFMHEWIHDVNLLTPMYIRPVFVYRLFLNSWYLQNTNTCKLGFLSYSTDFTDTTNVESTQPYSRCFGDANIKEEGIGITVRLCVDDIRQRHVYTSSTNMVEIQFAIEEGSDASRFVFHFEGVSMIPSWSNHVQQMQLWYVKVPA